MGHRTERPRIQMSPPVGYSLAMQQGGRVLHLVISRRDTLSLCGEPVSLTFDANTMTGRPLCRGCSRRTIRTRVAR